MVLRIFLIAATLPAAALAQAYDGVYYPSGMSGWSCQTIGMDGGAVAIRDGQLMGVENTCDLTNPVGVTGMEATLYDMECSAEGTTYTERVMLMHSGEGVYVIRDGFVAEWARCE